MKTNNAMLVLKSGSLKELVTSVLVPERAKRVQIFSSNSAADARNLRSMALRTPEAGEGIIWSGALIEKVDDGPVIRRTGFWQTTPKGTRNAFPLEIKEASSRLVIKRRGWLSGIHRDGMTGDITVVFSGVSAHLASATQIKLPTPKKFL